MQHSGLINRNRVRLQLICPLVCEARNYSQSHTKTNRTQILVRRNHSKSKTEIIPAMFFSMINLLASFPIIIAGYAANIFIQKTNYKKQVDETYFIMKTTRACHLPIEYNSPTLSQCGYTHCPAKSVKKIIENIDNAQHLVYISMSEINMNEIVWALERARRRGVIVRVIVDKYKFNSRNVESVTQLELAGKMIDRIAFGMKLCICKYFSCTVQVSRYA